MEIQFETCWHFDHANCGCMFVGKGRVFSKTTTFRTAACTLFSAVAVTTCTASVFTHKMEDKQPSLIKTDNWFSRITGFSEKKWRELNGQYIKGTVLIISIALKIPLSSGQRRQSHYREPENANYLECWSIYSRNFGRNGCRSTPTKQRYASRI